MQIIGSGYNQSVTSSGPNQRVQQQENRPQPQTDSIAISSEAKMLAEAQSQRTPVEASPPNDPPYP